MKRIAAVFTTLLVLFMCVILSAHAEKYKDFEYKVMVDGTVRITKYTGLSGIVSIPSTIDGKKVTQIGKNAFQRKKNLTTLSIPDGVTSIGEQAFSYCENLTNIVLPNSLISIGDLAFYECRSFTSIVIPDNVTSIGGSAFSYCRELRNITINGSETTVDGNPFSRCDSLVQIYVTPENQMLASINGVLFNKETKQLICYPSGKKDSTYEIPYGINSIGPAAFVGSNYLTSVSIPDSITNIKEVAFLACEKMNNIIIPNSVITIGKRAFDNCTDLTDIIIPSSVISIDDQAFSWCSSLKTITIQGNKTKLIGQPFARCNKLQSFSVPFEHQTLETIDGVLFDKIDKVLIRYPGNKAATTYEIPDGTKNIGDNAFYSCSILSSVTIPNSVIRIGNAAFSRCDNLKSVIIPSSVMFIGQDAFNKSPWARTQITLTVPKDSYAAQYAQNNKLSYTYPDSLDWLNK